MDNLSASILQLKSYAYRQKSASKSGFQRNTECREGFEINSNYALQEINSSNAYTNKLTINDVIPISRSCSLKAPKTYRLGGWWKGGLGWGV